MRVALLGGTKGIGRAVARLLVARGDELVLLGRNPEDLERSAEDLRVRKGDAGKVHTVACDLADFERFEDAVDEAFAVYGSLDAVIVTAGAFGTQEQLESDPALAHRVVSINFANTVSFCEAARKRLMAQDGGGTLCVVSSVAGDRGRKPVVIYGASKAGLSAYLEGLDHRHRAAGLKTVCIKPGFVKTGMTEGLDPPPFAGTPEQVAKIIVHAMDRGTPVAYAPGIWRLVMMVIRRLPRFVMRRVGF